MYTNNTNHDPILKNIYYNSTLNTMQNFGNCNASKIFNTIKSYKRYITNMNNWQ